MRERERERERKEKSVEMRVYGPISKFEGGKYGWEQSYLALDTQRLDLDVCKGGTKKHKYHASLDYFQTYKNSKFITYMMKFFYKFC